MSVYSPDAAIGPNAEVAEAEPKKSRATWATSAVSVAGLTLLIYSLYLAIFFAEHHDARQFIVMYRAPFARSHASSVIKLDPTFKHYVAPKYAYDGQWYYFIALDPANAQYYVDDPAGRYAKFLYPLTARLLALGRANLIPYTLILVNLLAVVAGTLILAAWLAKKGVSPWFALLYAFYAGTFHSFLRDLTEPMSYGLLLAAIYWLDFGPKYRLTGSGVFFALAILARDKAAIFAIVYGAALLFQRRDLLANRRLPAWLQGAGQAAWLLAIAGIPMLIYKVFLYFWLHKRSGVSNLGVPTHDQSAPLTGLLQSVVHPASLVWDVPTVYVPTAICVVIAAWALYRRMWRVEIFLLLISFVVAVITLNPVYFSPDYSGVTRVSIATMLAALLCLPTFFKLTDRRAWLTVCAVGWCGMTLFLSAP
jgi:hypothetical protein